MFRRFPITSAQTGVTNIRKEIELVEKEQYIKEVQCKDNETVDVPAGNLVNTGLMFKCTWVNKEEEPTTSYIFLFLSKDKYIKVRGSMANAADSYNIDDFVKQAIAAVQVPEEDIFMAKIRQQQRQSTFQNN